MKPIIGVDDEVDLISQIDKKTDLISIWSSSNGILLNYEKTAVQIINLGAHDC